MPGTGQKVCGGGVVVVVWWGGGGGVVVWWLKPTLVFSLTQAEQYTYTILFCYEPCKPL